MLYGGDCPTYVASKEAIQGSTLSDMDQYDEDVEDFFDAGTYYQRLSELAQYFVVKGMEDVIVPRFFVWETISGLIHKELHTAISVIFQNAVRGESHKAQVHIARFVVDYFTTNPTMMKTSN